MRKAFASAGIGAAGLLALALLAASPAAAQDPILTPVIAGTAAPIVVKAVTPKPKPGVQKFKGYFLNASNAQVTLKSQANEMIIQTFPLSDTASTKMQKVIDKGGYQHGDKVTVYFDAQTHRALNFKGRPSRPL